MNGVLVKREIREEMQAQREDDVNRGKMAIDMPQETPEATEAEKGTWNRFSLAAQKEPTLPTL